MGGGGTKLAFIYHTDDFVGPFKHFHWAQVKVYSFLKRSRDLVSSPSPRRSSEALRGNWIPFSKVLSRCGGSGLWLAVMTDDIGQFEQHSRCERPSVGLFPLCLFAEQLEY